MTSGVHPPAVRIVSLVPSVTRTLFDLGAGEEIVGVTRFCVDPPPAKERATVVGGTKDPDVAKVRSLAPDLVLGNREENRAPDLDALRAAGLRVETVDPVAVRDVPEVVRALGRLTGREAGGDRIAGEVQDAIDAAVEATLGWKRLRVFVPVWREPLMTVNRDTYVASLVEACGGVNVFGHKEKRYPVVTREEVVAATPQAVLLPTEPYRFAEKHVPEFEGLGAPRARIMLVDGQLLTWWGSLTPKAIRHYAGSVQGLVREVLAEAPRAPP